MEEIIKIKDGEVFLRVEFKKIKGKKEREAVLSIGKIPLSKAKKSILTHFKRVSQLDLSACKWETLIKNLEKHSEVVSSADMGEKFALRIITDLLRGRTSYEIYKMYSVGGCWQTYEIKAFKTRVLEAVANLL